MKNSNLLKRKIYKTIFFYCSFCSFLSILFYSCDKNEKNIIPDIEPEKDDIIENIVDYPTIHCQITNWYNNYSHTTNFTWDDANSTHSKIVSIFNKYDCPTTFFIQTSAFKDKKTVNEYLKFSEDGHEIGSHSFSHINLTQVDPEALDAELKNSSNDIYTHFGFYPASFSHPYSAYNIEVDKQIAKYFLSSRYSSYFDMEDRSFMALRSAQQETQLISDFENFISDHKKNWKIYGGHGVDGIGFEPIQSKILENLLTYIKDHFSSRVWVTTFANSAMYKFLKDNIKIEYGSNFVFLNRNHIKKIIQKYSDARCVITLFFPDGKNVQFQSAGILYNQPYKEGRLVSIDLRKSRIIEFIK